jgi:hypothetical protein
MSEVLTRPLVRLRNLHVTFRTRDRTVHAVNGVDMDVAQGEVLCILGEERSGKSVTLRRPDEAPAEVAHISGRSKWAGATFRHVGWRADRFRGRRFLSFSPFLFAVSFCYAHLLPFPLCTITFVGSRHLFLFAFFHLSSHTQHALAYILLICLTFNATAVLTILSDSL